jgi:hypothetical protein
MKKTTTSQSAAIRALADARIPNDHIAKITGLSRHQVGAVRAWQAHPNSFKSPVTSAKVKEAHTALIHLCLQRGIESPKDIKRLIAKVGKARFSPVQVAGCKAADTKNQKIPWFNR